MRARHPRSRSHCTDLRPHLNRWVEGQLRWFERRRVQRHLDVCPLCAEEVRRLEEDTLALLEGVFPPPNARQLDDPLIALQSIRSPGGRPASVLIAVLATIFLAIGGIFFFANPFASEKPAETAVSHSIVTAADRSNDGITRTLDGRPVRFDRSGPSGAARGTTPRSVAGQPNKETTDASSVDAAPTNGFQRPTPTTAREGARVDRNPGITEVSGVIVDRTGRPIEGARVTITRLPIELGDVLYLSRAHGRTNAPRGTIECVSAPDGSFRFSKIVGRVGLVVTRDGYAAWSRLLTTPIGIEVVLTAESRMIGSVIDHLTRRPIAGARITYRHPGTAEPVQNVVSGRDGRYRLRGIAPENGGPYAGMVVVTADGYAKGHFAPIYSGPNGVAERDLPLHTGRSVTGVLSTRDGRPVGDATVAIDDGVGKRVAADGSFTISGATSISRLTVRGPGWMPRKIALSRMNADRSIRIEMRPGHPLEGTVVNSNGGPVVGLGIEARLADASSGEAPVSTLKATTDRDGAFRFDATARDAEYVITTGGAGQRTRREHRVRNVAHRSRPLELTVDNVGSIRGRVLLASEPVEGATVYLHDNRGTKPRIVATCVTGRNGAFALSAGAAPSGSDKRSGYLLSVPGPGFRPWFRPVRVRPGETTVKIARLETGLMITGRIVDENERPVEGATLWTVPRTFPVVTDRDGRFRFRGLDGRDFAIHGIAPDLFFATGARKLAGPIRGGTRELELTMPQTPVFHGTVRDADSGRGLFPVIILQRFPESGFVRTAMTLRDGRFRFPPRTKAATMELAFFIPGHAPKIMRVARPSAEQVAPPLEVNLVRSRKLRGRVRSPGGGGARGAVFVLPSGDAARRLGRDRDLAVSEAAWLDEDGTFAIHVPAPDATLFVVTQDGSREVTIDGRSANALIEVEPAARITLDVRDETGSPARLESYLLARDRVNVGYRWLSFYKRAGLHRLIRRGIAPVPPGTYRLRITTKNGRTVEQSVQLQAGENTVRMTIG